MANDGLCYQAYAGPAPASALRRRRRVGDYRILYVFNDAEVRALCMWRIAARRIAASEDAAAALSPAPEPR